MIGLKPSLSFSGDFLEIVNAVQPPAGHGKGVLIHRPGQRLSRCQTYSEQ
jgi:hypothetical protein